MDKIKYITINKNRGWRGLAQVRCLDEDRNEVTRMVFSFSQQVWDDMQKGLIVIQNEKNYILLSFTGTDILPKGQRSVLIKNFEAKVINVNSISKDAWMKDASNPEDYNAIRHFITNKNNHTTSDWNYIGIRVIPAI